MDDKAALKILKDALNSIEKIFSDLDSDSVRELEKITGNLWMRKISNNIYSDPNESKQLMYNAQRVASFIILIQFLVYHILQTHRPDSIKTPLQVLIKSRNLHAILKEFGGAEDPNSENFIVKEIFEYDLLSRLRISENKKEMLNEGIEKVMKSGFQNLKADVLGKIFHSLIPLEIRRKLAAFYSSNWAGRILAELSVQRPEDMVLDLTCGSGTLLVESYHVKKEHYGEIHPELNENKIHKLLLNEIYGADISEFAVKLARANLILQNVNDLSCKVNIISGDGLSIVPKGHILSKNSGIVFPMVDCIIMNPPFSRQRDMSDETMAHLESTLKSYGLGEYIDNKMGLHGYFILHADQFLKEGGIMAMILPATTFNADYTEKLLKFLKSKEYSIKYVFEILSKRNAFSEDCAFKEYMVILQKDKYTETENTLFITFLKEPPLDMIKIIVDSIKKNQSCDFFEIKEINMQKAYQNLKWRELFLDQEQDIHQIFNAQYFQPYSALKKKNKIRIFRGFDATYADYVMVPNRWWNIEEDTKNFLILHKQAKDCNTEIDNERIKLPKSFVVRTIRRTANANEVIIHPDSYVINLNPSIIEMDPDLQEFNQKYLKFMKQRIEEEWTRQKSKGHKRVSVRESWYAHPNKHHCDKTIGHLFHFYKYTVKTRKTITSYTKDPASIHFGFGYVIHTQNNPFYAAWFNSSLYYFTLFKNQQLFAKSFFKMTIENFQSIILPDYAQFSDELSNLLPKYANILDKFWNFAEKNENEIPDLPAQFKVPYQPRVELDRAWLLAIGYNENKISELLTKLYTWLSDYIEKR